MEENTGNIKQNIALYLSCCQVYTWCPQINIFTGAIDHNSWFLGALILSMQKAVGFLS